MLPSLLVPALRQFTFALAAGTTLALAVMALTPLGTLWFVTLTGLAPAIVPLASLGLTLSIGAPALSALQSWYQGVIVHSRRTRAVTESVGVYLVTIAVILGAGVVWGRLPGLWVAVTALVVGNATQVVWLWWRGRVVIRRFRVADQAALPSAPPLPPTPPAPTP